MKQEPLDKEQKEWIKRKVLNWSNAVRRSKMMQSEIGELLEIRNENSNMLTRYPRNQSLATIDYCLRDEISRLQFETSRMMQEKALVDGVLDCLLDDEIDFLERKFKRNQSVETIVAQTYISRTTCFRLQDRIFTKLYWELRKDVVA